MSKSSVITTVVGAGIGAAGFMTGNPMLMGMGASMALGGLASALAPAVPKPGNTRTKAPTQTAPEIDPLERLLYGHARRTPGVVVGYFSENKSQQGPDENYLIFVCVLGSRPITSVKGMWVGNRKVTFDFEQPAHDKFYYNDTMPKKDSFYWGKIGCYINLGDTPNNDDWLRNFIENNEGTFSWTENHKLTGLPHVRVAFRYDAAAFPNASVPSFVFDVEGYSIFDPRDDGNRYTVNAALCLYDFLRSRYYAHGGLEPDRISVDHVIAAANVCDEQINRLGDGSTERYAVNGLVSAGEDPYTIEQLFLDAMAGYASREPIYRMWAGAPRLPVRDLSDADVIGKLSITPDRPLADRFNTVKALFVDQRRNSMPGCETMPVSNQVYLQQDGGRTFEKLLDLDNFVDNNSQAQRLCKIALERNRQGMSMVVPVLPIHADLEELDCIRLTLEGYPGISNKHFLIMGIEDDLATGIRGLTVDEYDSTTIYAWEGPEEEELVTEGGDGPEVTFADIFPELLRATSVSIDTLGAGPWVAYRNSDPDKFASVVNIYRSPVDSGPWTFVTQLPRPATAGAMLSELPVGIRHVQNIGEDDRFYVDLDTYRTLTSIDDAQLARRGNLCWIGETDSSTDTTLGEWLQFQYVEFRPELGTRVWRCSGLRRGLFGTERYMGLHGSGEVMIMFNDAMKHLNDDASVLNNMNWWRAQHAGRDDDVAAIGFINRGESRKPLPPEQVRLLRAADGRLRVTWMRRDRGHWGVTVPPPLAEPRLSFLVRVFNGSSQVRETLINDAQEWTYSTSQQTTDWGSPQNRAIDIGVCQRSDGFGAGDFVTQRLPITGTFA